jgi:hypothetical protein
VTNAVEIGQALIIEGRWEGRDPGQPERAYPFFMVVTTRNGRIVEMQDCSSRDKAVRYAKRRAN